VSAPDIISVAKKQRHIVLLGRVREGKALSKAELAELEKLEAAHKAQEARSKANRLTVKQQAFVDAFAGDIKAAAKAAGLNYGYCRLLLTKNNKVRKAIHDRQETEIRPVRIASRQERQQFWTKTMLDNNVDYRDRLRASELLGRSEADFTENMNHRFPKGCGVLRTDPPMSRAEFEAASAEQHKNGKNGNNDENPNDGDNSGRGDSSGADRR